MEDSLPSKFNSSVKGNLEGQAWLTRVPCLVKRGPKECNRAQSARRASMVNTGPMSCEASQPRCCGYSLWANVPWRFVVMEWIHGVKSRLEGWKSSSGTLEESCEVCIHRMIQRGEDVPIGRSGACSEEGGQVSESRLKVTG